MAKPIVRTEVQATPTIDILGKETYEWKVYQVVDGVNTTLQSGFTYELLKSSQEALDAVRKYI